MKNAFVIILIIASVILAITITGIITTLSINNNFNVCFSNECFKQAYEYNKYVINFFIAATGLLASVMASLGIYIAALSYKNTSKSNSLSNHISHFNVFTNYLEFEVRKNNIIKSSSINTFNWYNLMFSESINGSTSVSEEYIEKINSINSEIKKTNQKQSKSSYGPYRYKEHQNRLIKAISEVGIKLEFGPRNDYLIIEGEVFNLINNINKAFCHNSNTPELEKRKYI